MGSVFSVAFRWLVLLACGAWLTGCGGSAGLVAHKYTGSWSSLPDFASLTPVSQHVVPSVGTHELGDTNYGLVLKGKISVDEAAQYRFHLRSDDGSKLYINNILVIDNDGSHTAQTVTSESLSLASGEHEIRIEYFQVTGEQVLQLSLQMNDGQVAPVDGANLSYYAEHEEPDTGGGDSGGGDPGGGDPGGGNTDDDPLTTDKQEYSEGDTVVVTYSAGSGSDLDWIGIYEAGTLGTSCVRDSAYVVYQYTNGTSGSASFGDLAPGDYVAQLFSDDTYCHIGNPVAFSIVRNTDPGGGGGGNLTLSKTEYEEGESVTVNYTGGTGSDQDWIGIFLSGTLNNSCDSTDAYITWQYTSGSSGSVSFSGLAAGTYQAQMFADDGYCHVGSSVAFTVERGDDTGGGTGDGVKIAFIGDTGTGSSFQNVLNLIKREGAELTIVAGDTSYSSSRDDNWDSMVRSTLGSSDPALVAAGNHDYGDSNFSDVRSYGEARLRQASQVSCSGDYAEKMTCRYKNLYFVLSAVGSGGSRSDHESYISSSLDNAPNGAWRICTWHKNQRDMQAGGKSDEVGWTSYENCRRKGAIIATGHEHSYSRTHLLSDMSDKTVASTSSTFTLTEGRTFAFVSGLGGIGIRDQERGGNWWASIYTSTQGANYGAMFGTFYDDRADFYFKTIDGQIIDRFTVMKGY